MIGVLGVLSACISGVKPQDTYVSRDGASTVIQSDKEICEHSCNDDYSRCMETTAAEDNSGINGPSGVFGASGDCRNDLEKCLPTCKGQ
jgi:hypothetical protein